MKSNHKKSKRAIRKATGIELQRPARPVKRVGTNGQPRSLYEELQTVAAISKSMMPAEYQGTDSPNPKGNESASKKNGEPSVPSYVLYANKHVVFSGSYPNLAALDSWMGRSAFFDLWQGSVVNRWEIVDNALDTLNESLSSQREFWSDEE
jgi:hypothetical protein